MKRGMECLYYSAEAYSLINYENSIIEPDHPMQYTTNESRLNKVKGINQFQSPWAEPDKQMANPTNLSNHVR